MEFWDLGCGVWQRLRRPLSRTCCSGCDIVKTPLCQRRAYRLQARAAHAPSKGPAVSVSRAPWYCWTGEHLRSSLGWSSKLHRNLEPFPLNPCFVHYQGLPRGRRAWTIGDIPSGGAYLPWLCQMQKGPLAVMMSSPTDPA